jgi:DNA-directed RNA polymerase specialized sigma24 family protein
MTLEQQSAPGRATIASIPFDDYTDAPLARLIEACARGEDAAWREFIRRYDHTIALTVFRTARCGDSSPHVGELVQDTYLKLCAGQARVLRNFRFDHEDADFRFRKYLKVVTANLVKDSIKVEPKPGMFVPLEEDSEPAGGPGPAALTPSERALLFDEACDFLRAVLPPETRDRDLRIFRLYFRVGLTAKQIAVLPFGLTVKGVESVLHKLIKLLRNGLGRGATGGG